jgi:hypothetical protein
VHKFSAWKYVCWCFVFIFNWTQESPYSIYCIMHLEHVCHVAVSNQQRRKSYDEQVFSFTLHSTMVAPLHSLLCKLFTIYVWCNNYITCFIWKEPRNVWDLWGHFFSIFSISSSMQNTGCIFSTSVSGCPSKFHQVLIMACISLNFHHLNTSFSFRNNKMSMEARFRTKACHKA